MSAFVIFLISAVVVWQLTPPVFRAFCWFLDQLVAERHLPGYQPERSRPTERELQIRRVMDSFGLGRVRQ